MLPCVPVQLSLHQPTCHPGMPLHRLGQTRTVTVHRLVTRGTVDRNILDIAERKLRLDAAIMDGVTLGSQQVRACLLWKGGDRAEADYAEVVR